jgi:4-diphosphocytidyl-2-C-methyl-D-erythritol kinase
LMACRPCDFVTSPWAVLARGTAFRNPRRGHGSDDRVCRYHRGIVTPVTAVTARAPAKVNLQLAVGPARAHGYHDVVTVYHAVSLFDEVTVFPAERDSVVITGEGADSVPADDTNLAARAVAALLRAVGPGAKDSPGLAIRISKRIPVAAGLAGGSADAAAALVACNELWRTGLSQAELSELAAGIGSDVAFGLVGGTAIGVGRGERVTPALAAGTYHWVLAFATGGLSTARVYAACDRIRAAQGRAAGSGLAARGAEGSTSRGEAAAGGHAAPVKQPGRAARAARAGRAGPAAPPGALALDNRLMAALRSGNPTEVGPLLSNDLQQAAISLRPELRRTLAAGIEHGALAAIVSGSGPTCAYLARDARHAAALAVALAGAGVCRTVVHVVGPVPGASVTSIATEPV